MKKILLPLLFIVSFLTGCATILGEPNQLLPIASQPNGASITVTDERGFELYTGTTPTTVILPKSDGSYWGGKSFVVTISKSGFETIKLPVETNATGMYIGGNLLFGGLIGWFIVDSMGGNMYTLSVDGLNPKLSPQSNLSSVRTKGGISIVLLDDVPAYLHSKLVKIN